MSGYICVKACNLGGVVYNKGDAIPLDAVLPSREKALVGQGFIARAESLESVMAENQLLKARIAELEQGQPEATEAEQEADETVETSAAVPRNKSRKR